MQKNYLMFVFFSIVTVIVWVFLSSSLSTQKQIHRNILKSQVISVQQNHKAICDTINKEEPREELINIETKYYKAIFTNKGAAILKWFIKEKNNKCIDLIFPGSPAFMSNFQDKTYKIISISKNKIIFECLLNEGLKITKIYHLSDHYMHNLNIIIEQNGGVIEDVSSIELKYGPGLGLNNKEIKENIATTRVMAYTKENPNKLEKIKNNSEVVFFHKWVSLDNRYFLAAFIPKQSTEFDKIVASRSSKKHPYSVSLIATIPKNVAKIEYSVDFYLGPKGYMHLKSYNLDLEKIVDFGFFGFLGKFAFKILTLFHKLTHNYGWAIVFVTALAQVLILPLTLKSFKSISAMKRIQPLIKDIQIRYKNNPKRIQIEILNIYRSQKVNPLSGCFPMLLQLPIFWAFFTMLRNSYELRNEKWIFWIKDLSAADQFIHFNFFDFNLLPILMGIAMFFQQKMTTTDSDSMQKKIMYIIPIVFTFMFWSFPSGVVIYWITNSIISMLEQYLVTKKIFVTKT
ncbi:MAG: membrane protein insertase YidC [Endomicrobium sp.]|jgi:YidC/Oxa1 family membrane protein insertase|nr:membrane protein insertase YidC [Endomicrobium sp.]